MNPEHQQDTTPELPYEAPRVEDLDVADGPSVTAAGVTYELPKG